MATPAIPTVDISEFHDDMAFATKLGEGYEEYGFCGVVGHGIAESVIRDAYEAMREFFALPAEIKECYNMHNAGARGYTSFGIETAKNSNHPDLKEFWQIGRELPDGQSRHQSMFPNVWPEEVADFRARVYGLYTALDELGNRILNALALYLALPLDYFADKVDVGNSILRPIHYPPITQPDTPSLRSAEHEDINLLTLLVGSDEPGLEVLTRSGDWLPVINPPGTIVANIGDMMQRLTNHVLPSTTHRVVNSPEAYDGESRYSTPFFLHPNPDFQIATLASCMGGANPNRYPTPISADDYLTERLIEIGLK